MYFTRFFLPCQFTTDRKQLHLQRSLSAQPHCLCARLHGNKLRACFHLYHSAAHETYRSGRDRLCNNPGNRWRPDGLTAAYQVHVSCVEDQTRARGGTPIGTSAYRPEQYQRHLFEIVQKDGELHRRYMTAHPECQALRDSITQQMGPRPGHDLKRGQLVATPGTSRHESGTAFDMTLTGLTRTQEAAVYSTCRVTRTAVRNEPWHTQ